MTLTGHQKLAGHDRTTLLIVVHGQNWCAPNMETPIVHLLRFSTLCFQIVNVLNILPENVLR